jgi:hypothetical protein
LRPSTTTDAEHDPAADPLLQRVPALEFDPRIAWQPSPPPLTRVRRPTGSSWRLPICPCAANFDSVPV